MSYKNKYLNKYRFGVENGNPLQHFCLENPKDRGAWQATAHRITESDMTDLLSISTDCNLFYKDIQYNML